MDARDHVASLLPWYVQGTLAEKERVRVERHLQSCRGCADLREQAAELKDLYASTPFALLEEHPQAQLLGEVADDPAALGPETVRWVLAHAAACVACGDALAACRALLAELEPRAAGPVPAPASARFAARVRRLLAGPILRPLPALAYLLALIALAIPAYRHLSEPGIETGVIAELPREIVVTDDLVRDATGPGAAIDLPRGGAVILRLQTGIDREDLQDPGAAFRVEIRRDGEVIWSERRTGAAFDPDGTIRITLDRHRLVAERPHLVAIVYEKPGDPMHGRVVFRRAFVVAGAPGVDPAP